MRHEEHGRPPLAVDPPERLEKLEAVPRVEPGGRLVEQPHLGLLREGARQEHAPPLAARERRRVAVGQALDVAGAHRLEREAPVFGRLGDEAAAVGRPALEHEIEASGSGRRDRRSAERTRCGARSRAAGSTRADGRRSGARRPTAGSTRARTFSRRRLAGAVLAEDRDDLSRGDVGIEPARAAARPVARREGRAPRSAPSRGPQEQPREERRSDRGGDRADGKLRRRERRPRHRVGRDEQAPRPRGAERGSSVRWSLPARRRTPWGTSSPTNPMTPANATAAPVRRDAARNTIRLVALDVDAEGRRVLLAHGEAGSGAAPSTPAPRRRRAA